MFPDFLPAVTNFALVNRAGVLPDIDGQMFTSSIVEHRVA
jgi:hypothetical protein